MCFDDSVDMHRSRRCWLQASRCFFFQFSDERAQLTMDNKSAFTSCGYSLGSDGSIRAAQTWRGFCLRPWGPWVFVPMALAEANRSPLQPPSQATKHMDRPWLVSTSTLQLARPQSLSTTPDGGRWQAWTVNDRLYCCYAFRFAIGVPLPCRDLP